MKRSTKPKAAAGGSFGFSGFSSSTTLSYITPPPDLSEIPQEVVVPFKNLLKKDSITKGKALEEIVAYVQTLSRQNGEPGDAILEAWAQLYARISIDNSRRVRELSHVLLLELLKSSGKRMEKRIPSLVGAWLAGSFERDRAVSRAATEGLSSFLDTPEKETRFWVRCKTQILDYAREAIQETPDTLSDERSSTKEDSEAKYYRVVGGSLSLVINLLAKAPFEQVQDDLDRYLSVDTLWPLAAAEDNFVRRALYQLLQILLAKQPEFLRPRLGQIGRVLVSDSLKSSQAGSATDLVKVLTKLTQTFPEVWGSKTHPLQRLRPFVEKGSQGGSATYWQELDALLSALSPKTPSLEIAGSFLKSLRTGISSRQEPRAHAMPAWGAYINAFERFLGGLAPDVKFVQNNLYPLTRQYLHPTPELSAWTSPVTGPLFPRAWKMAISHPDAEIRKSAEEGWQKLQSSFLSRMNNSLPEVSQDFQKSQQAVATEGDHWFTLAATILGQCSKAEELSSAASVLRDIITTSSLQVMSDALELLSRRNYKPFGVASVLQSAFKKCPELCNDEKFISALFPLESPEQLKILVTSPSFPYLVPCLDQLSHIQPGRFPDIWTAVVDSALQSNPATFLPVVKQLVSIPASTAPAHKHEKLQSFLSFNWLACANGSGSPLSWDLSGATLSFDAIDDSSMAAIIANLVDHLTAAEDYGPALRALELIILKKPALVSQGEDAHVALITKLLSLTELSDKGVSEKAASLQALLDQESTGDRPVVGIIQRSLEEAGQSSLGLHVLIHQAISAFESGAVQLEELFPNSYVWHTELASFLQDVPSPSLSLTSSTGGAYFLVKKPPGGAKPSSKRDAQGRSIPARMALYTAKLLSSGLPLAPLPEQFQLELLYLMCLTVELASDQLVSVGGTGLWEPAPGEGDTSTEIDELITLSRSIINGIVSKTTGWREGNLTTSIADRLVDMAIQTSRSRSPTALYSAKVLSSLLQALVAAYGTRGQLEDWFKKLDIMKVAPDTVFVANAFIVGFSEILASSQTVNILCNRLVSNMIGAFPGLEKTLCSVVLLNACMSVYEPGQVPVDNRKQVMALKQMTSWTDTPDEMIAGLAAETCKGLHRLFPNVKGVYGPYWEQTVDYCITLWKNAADDTLDARLPYVHSSLKLMAALESATDASEDLTEALEDRAEAKSEALISLLKIPREKITQPCQIVDALLSRAVDKIPLEHIADTPDLYGLIASDSRDIQTAAFGILHRVLPAAQEALAVDVLLEGKDVSLPDELLSLLLDAPTLEAYPDDVLNQFPTPVRAYLLAWHLIFDAYSKATFKLRNDYSESLKKQDFVKPFLTFMFDVLGHSAGNDLKLERMGFSEELIRSYDIKLAGDEGEERNMHWLLIHLFYLTLKHMPGLFRAWYLDSQDKQTKNAIKPWLIKYFSPLIVSDAMDEVIDWAEKQEAPADGENELVVKVSKSAREVTAGYEVDEEVASIMIQVPPSFPLDTVKVNTVKRVAVNEQKWKGWLLATEGVIKFGNGGITDGLSTFRRNIVGTLKGQTECAICYSIVSSDKRLPDKECGTCRHSFHRICLYKWFQNSGRNSCPLCRNPIDILGSAMKKRDAR
ncbi:hypothetical protein B0T25DRAFT_500101 [Lasiosphaeria hispida]|uniref:E3 ubiquitin-protein ligase listerin n=1 Tax=Lasiosphaeria hispida TaxID=260671 RepID=A0AAJ0HGH2_9PEZI|nr:hypothetical protein B0T25DRAFT_500101 [Lasiosphaeria hispida]